MADTRDAFPVYKPTDAEPPRATVLDADGFRVDAHAVVVGINEYQDARIPALRYARADAQAMYDVLTDPTIGRFKPANVTLLLDEQASYKRIKSEIGTRLPKRTDENSTVCVYFAGHGAPYVDARHTSRDGMEKYLIPHDADADDLRASGLSMEALQDYFGYITSRQLIFFLDCCYSGGAGGGRSFDVPGLGTRATLSADFLESLSNDARFIVTACGMNEVSLETTEIGHGLFTYFLVEGLKGKADADGDGLVTMDELYSFVCDNVERESKKLGGRMRPMRAGKASGDVYLTQYETESQRRTKEANAEAVAAFEAGDLERAHVLWSECLALSPDHERATLGLAVISARIAEAHAAREALMAERQRTLVKLRRAKELSLEDYAQAVDLLEADPASLSLHLQELHSFAEAVADGRITASQYLKSVQYSRATATPSQQTMPQPAVVKQMAAERLAARANTGSVDTAKQTGLPKLSMTPPISPSISQSQSTAPPAKTPPAKPTGVMKPDLEEHDDDARHNARVTPQQSAPSPPLSSPPLSSPPLPSPLLSKFTPPDKETRASTIDVSTEAPSITPVSSATVSAQDTTNLRVPSDSESRAKRTGAGSKPTEAEVDARNPLSVVDRSRGVLPFALGLLLGTGFVTTVDQGYVPVFTSALSTIGALYLGLASDRATVSRNGFLGGIGWCIATFGYLNFNGKPIRLDTVLFASTFVLGGVVLAWIGHGILQLKNRKSPRDRR